MTLLTSLQVGVAMELRELGGAEPTAAMEPVHILTDGELDHFILVQLDDGHVRWRGQGLDKRDNLPGLARVVPSLGTKLPDPWASR